MARRREFNESWERRTYNDGVLAADERRSLLGAERSICDDASYVKGRLVSIGAAHCDLGYGFGSSVAGKLTSRSRRGEGSGLSERRLEENALAIRRISMD